MNLLMLAFLATPFVSSTPANYTPSALQWKNCTVDNFPSIATLGVPAEYIPLLETAPNLDCAEMEVPIDWSDPEGGNITLGMARYHTTGIGPRLGTIIYNPGGPGGSGALSAMAQALGIGDFSNATTGQYDVVGPDPRGVGLSTPLKCDPSLYNARSTTFPTSSSQFDALINSNANFGGSCRNMTGDLFFHLDTASVARDIEALRAALNEGPLNFLGLSYGSQIGSAYTELYPTQIGRMVLDGNIDHSQSEISSLHVEATSYEDTLNQFFSWCNTTATPDECPFQNQDLPRLFEDLLAKAAENPIPALGCSGNGSTCSPQVSDVDIRYNVQDLLIFVHPIPSLPNSWPLLAQALAEAMNGNATLLSTPLATSDTDALFPALGIACLDWFHNATSVSDLLYKQTMAATVAPLTRGASQTYEIQSACLGWPADVVDPQHYLDQTALALAPLILLVNALHDPETGYVWAEGLREQMPSAVLLTRNGSGHTSYPLGGATTAAIDAYLVNGTLPARNTVLDS